MIVPTAGLPTILPALIGFILPIASLKIKSRHFYALTTFLISVAVLLMTGYNLALIMGTPGTVLTYAFGGWPPPLGIAYTIDFINAVLGFLTATLFTLVSAYLFWYFGRIESGYEWMSTLTLLLLSGVLGCLYTGDIFNFFVMLEVLCISSYALVAFFRRRKWAVEASMAYAFIGALATTLFFFGVVVLYGSFGTVNIADLVVKVHGVPTQAQYLSGWSGSCESFEWCYGNAFVSSALAVALMLWALNFEAGIFPNNYWIPSAYTEAPTPASALFAGIVDKVGSYGVVRVFFTLFTGFGSTLMFTFGNLPFRDVVLIVLGLLGLATGYIGAFLMIAQRDVKRLLSYSTISHIGIIFTALAAGLSRYDIHVISLSVAGILLHMVTHALGESLLFLGLGTLATVKGSRDLNDLTGLGRRYPVLSASIVLGFLSLLGVVPLAGFFSKYLLFMSLIEANLTLHAVSIVLISGISAIGYFRVIYTLWIKQASGSNGLSGKEVTLPSIILPLMALMLLGLGLTLVYGNVLNTYVEYVRNAVSLEGVLNYVKAVEEASKILGG
ncbi:MAG: hypothetical protein B7O98_06910 [Zestosphaera tikiterensis]|uniref:NADH:quinone oxidoreductase/Mrp antiporter transmembrane domain-containing protein n=1 Tax=Zestosphaera tikiterensis TaxID=1973259 RepID=A0A2R7Y4B0_9CREN|nr:MAG: hypothetical protein B7O98_06910 [Zestosphaera tikiterensis]